MLQFLPANLAARRTCPVPADIHNERGDQSRCQRGCRRKVGLMKSLLRQWLVVTSACALGVLAAAPARAELVILKSGGQAEGQILNADRDAKQPVKLRTESGMQ